jgi:hypothetical protein
MTDMKNSKVVEPLLASSLIKGTIEGIGFVVALLGIILWCVL